MSRTREILESPMSDVLIQKYFNGRANIKTLAQISQMNSFEELMSGYEHVIIFMALQAQNSGHWVCMFINSGNLFYFDSYGHAPLQPLKKLIEYNMDTFGQNFNLMALVKNSPYADRFYFNNVQYQSDSKDVAVCGRYASSVCILNMIYKDKGQPFNFDVFKALMDMWRQKMGGKSYDEVIVYFINKV